MATLVKTARKQEETEAKQVACRPSDGLRTLESCRLSTEAPCQMWLSSSVLLPVSLEALTFLHGQTLSLQ